MSRIADSIKALKAERRIVAAKLSRIDRLIGGFEALNQLQPRRRRRPTAKAKAVGVKKAEKSRPRGRNNVILGSQTASLSAAAQA